MAKPHAIPVHYAGQYRNGEHTQLYFSCNTRLHSHRFADRRLVQFMLEPVTLHFGVRRAPKLSAPPGDDVTFAREMGVRGEVSLIPHGRTVTQKACHRSDQQKLGTGTPPRCMGKTSNFG